MMILNRLRPYLILVPLGAGVLLIEALSPLDWWDGLMLLLCGSTIGGWSDKSKTSFAQKHKGPLLRWDEMHPGEKLEHFFVAMSVTVIGMLVVVVLTFSSDNLADKWVGLLAGGVFVATGLGLGYWNWIHRYGAVESE
jgi:hypothetical protein